ncbi:hypothetical protein MMON_55070 [Mycolicibacterium monacense]|uniref:Uncharacterized protein n=1 Tax=Mycolicibacterium monacense TaxID=85693 RepID=A0AAD1N2J7_MYCMB|nr:hypothetical protein MMON_55070 [Mycolicibacterium monacense]
MAAEPIDSATSMWDVELICIEYRVRTLVVTPDIDSNRSPGEAATLDTSRNCPSLYRTATRPTAGELPIVDPICPPLR